MLRSGRIPARPPLACPSPTRWPHLLDVLLHPVVVPVHAVPPDVGLLGNCRSWSLALGRAVPALGGGTCRQQRSTIVASLRPETAHTPTGLHRGAGMQPSGLPQALPSMPSGGGAPPCWDSWLGSSLAGLRERELFRTLRPTIPGNSAVEVLIPEAELEAWLAGRPPPRAGGPLPTLASREGLRTLKLFSLNDYLGLSTHPKVCEATAAAALQCGSGPRSSALVGGYTVWHRDLELALAGLKGTEDCLLFPTGFAANLAVATALVGSGASSHAPPLAIFSDELNHASIVDGARLARRGGAALSVYRHNDLSHLEQLLAAAPPGARRVVLTDSLFSMDGDFADLRGLAALRRKHGFLLAVDEAHATLVCGERGGGAAELFGVEADVDLHIGTLSKGFGCLGGFVACSRGWRDLLANTGRAQVFSTALPVPVVAAAQAALRVASDEPWRRRHLQALTSQLGSALGVAAQSAIVPIVLGPEAAAVGASMELLRAGLHVPAIRPPTVPRGTSRLRVSLSAAHSEADVAELVAAIRACGLQLPGAASGAGQGQPSARL